jgi:thiol-disulfide isomerase/thioredoxin
MSTVSVNLYDLSQGMAKNMSRQFIGKQIDGIWHTGIVVFGKEFYYGGGICQDPPSRTPYGNPMQKIDMGFTELPEELFIEFLEEIAPKFSADKYDLFENNCNNFTDACCEFLTGSKIPSHITGLPKEVLATPMGGMIKNMMSSAQQNMMKNSHPMFGASPSGNQGGSNFGGNQNGFGNFGGNTQTTQSQPSGPAVLSITDPTQFANVLKSSPGAIVDFFSYTCPPCMKIKPYFENLAKEYQRKCPELKFISVDTGVARQLSMTYQISSIPTFIGFFQGQPIETFKGADQNRLQSVVWKLETKINNINGKGVALNGTTEPQGPEFQLFNPTKKDFYTFSGSNYPLPIKNISAQLENFPNLNQADTKAIFAKFAENPSEYVKTFSADEKTYLINWIFETMFFIEISDKTIGFLDLLRMLSLEPSFLEIIYSNEDKLYQIIKFLEKPEAELKELPKGLKLVLLRFVTNLTATEKSKAFIQKNLKLFVELLVKVGNVYREDKASLYPVLMSIWNIVQNLSNIAEFKDVADTIGQFTRTVFNENNDNEVLLGSLLILTSLSYSNKDVRKEVSNKVEKAKLLKLEFSEDQNVGKISRDLADLIQTAN